VNKVLSYIQLNAQQVYPGNQLTAIDNHTHKSQEKKKHKKRIQKPKSHNCIN